MDTVTYPTPQVIEALNRDFVCFTVDTAQPGADGRALRIAYRLLWEPGLVFLDPRGNELRRFVGYRSPADFIAELSFVKALTDFLYRRYERAVEGFGQAAELSPEAAVAPEALYWKGIAVYRLTRRNLTALKQVWGELRHRYPNSTWSSSADVLDSEPTGIRQS